MQFKRQTTALPVQEAVKTGLSITLKAHTKDKFKVFELQLIWRKQILSTVEQTARF